MPPTPEASRAATVAARLAALPLAVADAACAVGAAWVASYPDGARPTSTVTLEGAGATGRGEHVGWNAADHARFAAAVAACVPRGRTSLGAWAAEMARRTPEPYDRAALEAAAIDLALRQAGTNLFRLIDAGVPPPVRYVVSFGRVDDPVAEAERASGGVRVELKVDVDCAWRDAVWHALATCPVAVLDWKGSGMTDDHERAHRWIPAALLEDPRPGVPRWSDGVLERLSFDADVRRVADLDVLPAQPVAVNVKPGRMGGVFEALACVAACTERGIDVYLGGMFEVGVGRAQAQTLAALLSPDAPNDVAPMAVGAEAPRRPPWLVLDAQAVGFGLPIVGGR